MLDQLVRHVLSVRPYLHDQDAAPRQVVLHLSAEMVAAEMGCNEATAWRWTQQLQATGYLHARPHFTTMTNDQGEQVTVVDGTLYAIRLQPGHRAHLSYADLTRQYRDLDADREAGRTARRAVVQALKLAEQVNGENAVSDDKKKMQGSTEVSISSKYLREQLKNWAVTPGHIETPLNIDPCIFSPDELGEAIKTVQDVIYLLPTVAEAHAIKRPALVGILAATLARALNDQHSRAWYCRIIWDAYAASVEGRGGLQVLAAQLARLDTDRREWSSLRRPAALLNARLRAA